MAPNSGKLDRSSEQTAAGMPDRSQSSASAQGDALEKTTLSPVLPVGAETLQGSSSSAVDPNATRTMVFQPSSAPESLRIDSDLLDVGTVFDEFELVRFLGSGGMGRVFLAQDTNLGRTVALKVLYSNKVSNEEVLHRFRTEAQSMAALNHPNIVQIYAFREHPEAHQLYVAMEYVPGVNVRDQVNENGPLSAPLTVTYALQIAHALAHLKARNIVHRDIKPSNILITEDEVAKLIDFGLARQFDPNINWELESQNAQNNDLTASGVTLGTFDYISPEQARDPRAVDCRSDIYSLGCTLYFMLTGNPPFPQGNPLQKLLQHQSDHPLDVRLHRTDVPESLCQVLIRMMMKNPDDRYQTPAELVQDLELVAAELGLSPKYGFGMTHQIAEDAAAGAEDEIPIFHWKVLKRHLFWLVPLAVLLVTLVVLNELWKPNPDEVQIPKRTLPSAVTEPETEEPAGAYNTEEVPSSAAPQNTETPAVPTANTRENSGKSDRALMVPPGPAQSGTGPSVPAPPASPMVPPRKP